MNQPQLDDSLIASNVIKVCLDLCLKYEMNSLLHLSVQRIALFAIEGGNQRRKLQQNILQSLKLMETILEVLTPNSSSPTNDESLTPSTISTSEPSQKKPIAGHMLVIAQAIVGMCHTELEQQQEEENEVEVGAILNTPLIVDDNSLLEGGASSSRAPLPNEPPPPIPTTPPSSRK